MIRATLSTISRFIYALIRIGGGLLLHPYQTMPSLIKDRPLIWLTLLPSGALAAATIVWRVFIVVGQRWTNCSEWITLCELSEWARDWLTSFMIIWQVVLLYLLFRFRWIERKRVAERKVLE